MTDLSRDGHPATPEDTSVLVGFKSHLKPMVVRGEAVYLISRRGVTALRGMPAEVLVPLLDGTRSPAAVLREASPALTADETRDALRRLSEAGLVRFSPRPGRTELPSDRAAEAYWDLAGLDGARATRTLAEASVRILPLAGTDPGPVREACLASGIRPDDSAGFTLVLCDDYLSPELAEVDRVHRSAGTAWLPVLLCGTEPWVGPFFGSGDGPCWSCLAARLRLHRRAERAVQHTLGLDRPPAAPSVSLPAGRALAVNTAVLEAAKWLAGLRYAGQSSIHVLDTLTLASRSHPVPRLPQCAVCGDPGLVAERVRAPFVPVSRLKAGESGNGHRALTPEQMLERHGHLVEPVTGIVKAVRRAPRAPGFTETYLSGHNLAVGAHSLSGLRAGLRALSGGKGLTPAEARVSALCEAVERYSGTRHGDEPTVRGSYRELAADALLPNSCQLYHDRQFEERGRWNASGSPFQYVPERFDEDRPMDWTPAWSLTGLTHRLLPTSMAYFPSGPASPHEPRADSNGNAAGSSPEDAVVQGFLELVERDAVALWWYNRTRQPAVDLRAFRAPYLTALLDGYRGLGREVWVLDLTSDFGIPVMAALSRRTDVPTEDIIFGFGAHFDPRVALRRAVTELGQMLPAVADVQADGSGYGVADLEPRTWWLGATVTNQPYLRPDEHRTARTPDAWEYVPRPDLRDDIAAITEAVASKGMELLVLDQTRPDIGLPVFKVIVPGMRHFWARFAFGRLYDVPVELGRVAQPTPYEDLNPTPLFV
ncbi:TOMM precursor leader peptide-binding protein [Streptomyces argenteolus]|uniref:TOMM leader peptide-binding protein n=1 Tax=Streptomyces argenteolus TaxID=67274 RepID=A0ABW6XBR2_9ACTN